MANWGWGMSSQALISPAGVRLAGGRVVALLAIACAPLCAVGTWKATWAMWHGVKGPWQVDDAVVLVAGVAVSVLAAYLGLTGFVALITAWCGRGHGVALRLSPRLWRGVVASAVGLGLSAASAPAFASEVGWVEPPSDTQPLSAARVVDPLNIWAPELHPAAPASLPASGGDGVEGPHDEAPAAPVTETSPSAAYVVQPGDSLWAITSALLGPEASAADVATAWPSLYQANRDIIGDDPSLIFAGQALVVPQGFGA